MCTCRASAARRTKNECQRRSLLAPCHPWRRGQSCTVCMHARARVRWGSVQLRRKSKPLQSLLSPCAHAQRAACAALSASLSTLAEPARQSLAVLHPRPAPMAGAAPSGFRIAVSSLPVAPSVRSVRPLYLPASSARGADASPRFAAPFRAPAEARGCGLRHARGPGKHRARRPCARRAPRAAASLTTLPRLLRALTRRRRRAAPRRRG